MRSPANLGSAAAPLINACSPKSGASWRVARIPAPPQEPADGLSLGTRIRSGPPYNPETYANGVYEQVWNTEMNLAWRNRSSTVRCSGPVMISALPESNQRHVAGRPTGVVDREAWIERLQHYAEWGMNLLNVAAFFVPGLGEMMMGVTAVQLGYEVFGRGGLERGRRRRSL